MSFSENEIQERLGGLFFTPCWTCDNILHSQVYNQMGVSSHEDEGVDCRSEISVSACGVAEVLPARHFYVVQCDVFFTENGMETKDETHSNTLKSWLRDSYVGRLFWDKSFLHYFWTGGLFTFLNIFLVWLFIDIFKIPTLISSTVVIGGLFIIRYAVYRWLKIM